MASGGSSTSMPAVQETVASGVSNTGAAMANGAQSAGAAISNSAHHAGAAISNGAHAAAHHAHEAVHNLMNNSMEPGVGSILLMSLLFLLLIAVLGLAYMHANRIHREKEEDYEDFYISLSEDGHVEDAGDRLEMEQIGFLGNTTDFKEETSKGRFVGGMFTLSSGGHMLKYDIDKAVSMQVLFIFRHTMLANPTILKHMLICCAVAFVTFGMQCFLEHSFPDAVIFNGTFLSDLSSMSTFITSLIGILLGFFISTVMSRWWSMRLDTMGGLWCATDDICCLLGSHFAGAEWRKLRTLMLRYMLAAYELSYMQNDGTDDEVDLIVRRNLLTPEEAANLVGKPSKSQAIWTWVGYTFRELQKQGHLSEVILQLFYMKVVQARGAIGAWLVFLGTQLPFMYVQLLSTQVHFLCLLMAVTCGIATAKWVLHGEETSPVLKLVQMLMVTYFYNGCLEIGRAFSDPCGNDFSDFPRHAYHFFLRNEAEHFHSACERPPSCVQQAIADGGRGAQPMAFQQQPQQQMPASQPPMGGFNSAPANQFGSQLPSGVQVSPAFNAVM